MIPLFEKAHELALTDTEKEILEYFESHESAAVYLGINELSARLYISNATIIRFCKKLGLRGYNEFKYQVRRELEQLQHPVLFAGDTIHRSVAAFRDNIDALDVAKLEQAADILTSQKTLYIYGSSLSSLAARYLQIVLTTLDYPSIMIEWKTLLDGLMYGFDENCVLFLVTAHGDAERYLPIFKQAKAAGATTILVTCEAESPLIPYSTLSFCSNDRNEEYHHVDINTRIGVLTIIQILIELVVKKKRQE